MVCWQDIESAQTRKLSQMHMKMVKVANNLKHFWSFPSSPIHLKNVPHCRKSSYPDTAEWVYLYGDIFNTISYYNTNRRAFMVSILKSLLHSTKRIFYQLKQHLVKMCWHIPATTYIFTIKDSKGTENLVYQVQITSNLEAHIKRSNSMALITHAS